jgi:uncharacterized protein YidB (DUF937 family)
MDPFDGMSGKTFESLGLGGEGNTGLLNAVMKMLNNKESGGLSALVQAFKQKDLGDVISSWISTEKNLPITAEQLRQGIGEDKIREISEKAGISTEAALSQLTELLPSIIDKLTPNRKITEGNFIEKALEMLNGNASP